MLQIIVNFNTLSGGKSPYINEFCSGVPSSELCYCKPMLNFPQAVVKTWLNRELM